jgi:hypothetical protein
MSRPLIVGLLVFSIHTSSSAQLPPLPHPAAGHSTMETAPYAWSPDAMPAPEAAHCEPWETGYGIPGHHGQPSAFEAAPPRVVTPVIGLDSPLGTLWGTAPAHPPRHSFSALSRLSLRMRREAKHHKSPGNMLPVRPLYPVAHGTYYFKPYNFRMVPYQQAYSLRWSGRYSEPYTAPLLEELAAQAMVLQEQLQIHPQPPSGQSAPGLPPLYDYPEQSGEIPMNPSFGASRPASQFRPVSKGHN